MKEGDVIVIDVRERETGTFWEKKEVKYQILKIYKYFVLCRNIKVGYKECFSKLELRKRGRIIAAG